MELKKLKKYKNFINENSNNRFQKFISKEQSKYDKNFELAKTRA
jgi:hypothetical protein